ncbi:MAG TPA: SGNH/GDSL hydrolase family protein, partial [Pirellulales bacterium]|nr:SGNH/GDSL hydrolase family protein [Pirellulales bacterium]
MRLAFSLFLFFLLALAETATSDDTRPVIVTLGDSITKGVRQGVEPEQTFSAIVEKRLSVEGTAAEVVNLGIGGERTDQALIRLDAVIERRPNVVTIMYGTNDSYVDQGARDSRITRDQFGENLKALVVRLRERGIEPVLMTEPRWAATAKDGLGESPNLRLGPFMETCRQVARELRVPLVDHFAHWIDAEKNGQDLQAWTIDGCHPNPAGHEEIARLMVSVLLAALRSTTEDLTVLKQGGDGPPASKMVYHALHELARGAFKERREKFERLAAPEDCRRWQQERKEFFLRQLGGFPDRTPLDAQVVGRLDGDGYR